MSKRRRLEASQGAVYVNTAPFRIFAVLTVAAAASLLLLAINWLMR